ncbi:MAG: cell division protein FtsQ [Bacteroidia bacterium]|nr:cell division protein FtsQ [Bacteroidia bacterium]
MAFNKQKYLTWAKNIGYATLWLCLVCGLFVSVSFVNKQEKQISCTEINVEIKPTEAAYFVDREMILKTIRKDGNEKKIIGTKINEINISALEEKLCNNPMIKTAQVYSDMNGTLNIHIAQRRPILRILNAFGEGFYLDEDGLKMPLSPNYTAHSQFASGYIFEHGEGRDFAQSAVLKDLFKIATYVDKDTFWNAQIQQIFVTAESEFILIPNIGKQTILFGDISDMETKFKHLFLFYKEAITRVGWDKYSSINVKYKNQIIGKK